MRSKDLLLVGGAAELCHGLSRAGELRYVGATPSELVSVGILVGIAGIAGTSSGGFR